MFLRDLRYSLVRRWYFVLAGLLVTAGLGLATIRLVPSTFEATASVVLLPPTTAVTDVGNPYLVLGGLSQAVDVLIHRAAADAAQTPITSAYPGTTYTVQRDITTSGPIITIVVDGPTSTETLDALKAVMAMVPAQLGELQDQLSVAARSRISLMTLSQDAEPTTIDKARTRALLAVVAAGLVATVLLVGLLDGLMSGRRRRLVEGTVTEVDEHADGSPTIEAAAPSSAGQSAGPTSAGVESAGATSSGPVRTVVAEPSTAGSAAAPAAATDVPVGIDHPTGPPRASRIRMAPRHHHEAAGRQRTGWPVESDQPANGRAPGTTRR